jgi:hypothetical protein
MNQISTGLFDLQCNPPTRPPIFPSRCSEHMSIDGNTHAVESILVVLVATILWSSVYLPGVVISINFNPNFNDNSHAVSAHSTVSTVPLRLSAFEIIIHLTIIAKSVTNVLATHTSGAIATLQ